MMDDAKTKKITVASGAEAPVLYKSRQFWEDKFRSMGLWSPILAFDFVSRRWSQGLDNTFPEFQLVAISGGPGPENRVVGVAHAVPLRLGDQMADLPDTGWDWALETAMQHHKSGVLPNAICGLSITVLPEFQRRGVGAILISHILSLASRLKLSSVVMPVRPISKEDDPRLPIEEFLTLRRNDGFHQDAWIRTHQKAGATIVKPCARSMTAVAPIADWQYWCDEPFLDSGEHLARGCLAPVQIDIARGTGTYIESNVWMPYGVGKQK